MADDRGLGSPNMSASKKHEIQSKGGKASHGGGRNKQDEQYNSDLRGFAKMKEEGRDEEVKEIAREGGEASRGTENQDLEDTWEE